MTTLAELTTLRLGGPPRTLVEARDAETAIEAVEGADTAGEPLLVLAGGSNLVVADAGFPGTALRIATRGVERRADGERTLVTVAAGEPWDPLVERCVADGLAGFECLSGIPGSTGATPIQNVGAYGQDVSETLVAVRAYDRRTRSVADIPAAACGLSYRSSNFKRDPDRRLVLSATFALARRRSSGAIRYRELARELDVAPGGSAPLAEVRSAVLALRRRKGMVIDAADPDSVSAGSFFTNPILTPAEFEALAGRAGAGIPRFPERDGRVKTSAAWLVERAGFGRGYGMPGPVAVSTKHTLALTNRGGATTAQLLELATRIAIGVEDAFGVVLEPEPTLVGVSWEQALRAA